MSPTDFLRCEAQATALNVRSVNEQRAAPTGAQLQHQYLPGPQGLPFHTRTAAEPQVRELCKRGGPRLISRLAVHAPSGLSKTLATFGINCPRKEFVVHCLKWKKKKVWK